MGKPAPLYIVDGRMNLLFEEKKQYLLQFKMNTSFDPAMFSLKYTKMSALRMKEALLIIVKTKKNTARC